MRLEVKYIAAESPINNILLLVIYCLIIGHLTVQLFFPSLIINIIGLIALIIGLYKLGYQKDKFIFLISILLLSCFQYGNARGGIFNICAFMVLLAGALYTKNYFILKNPDQIINFLLLVFVVFNFTGIFFKSELPNFDKFLGAITFLGYIFIFNFSSRFLLCPHEIKRLIKVLVIIIIYGVLISINKYFNLIHFQSPLFGGEGRYGSSNLGGTFGPSPIYGEFGLLVYILLLPFLFSGLTKRHFRINNSLIIAGIIGALITILLSASRSAIILSIFGTVLFLILSFFMFRRALNHKINYILGMLIILFVFNVIGPRLNMEYAFSRFQQINPENINLETIASGEEINRAVAFTIGKEIISKENWFVGYGWGTVRSNRIAWFQDPDFYRIDPHSLYYSLPPLFGWIGTLSFIMIFLITIFRLLKISLMGDKKSPLVLSWLGFAVSLMLFLINEYKTTVLSQPHYFMIIWIWLGFSNALFLDYKINKKLGAGVE